MYAKTLGAIKSLTSDFREEFPVASWSDKLYNVDILCSSIVAVSPIKAKLQTRHKCSILFKVSRTDCPPLSLNKDFNNSSSPIPFDQSDVVAGVISRNIGHCSQDRIKLKAIKPYPAVSTIAEQTQTFGNKQITLVALLLVVLTAVQSDVFTLGTASLPCVWTTEE